MRLDNVLNCLSIYLPITEVSQCCREFRIFSPIWKSISDSPADIDQLLVEMEEAVDEATSRLDDKAA